MEDSRNKFQPDKKFFTICIYAVITTIICTFFIKIIWNWSDTVKVFSGLLSSLSPFLMGFMIAYIMGNLSISIDKHIFYNILHIKKPSIRKGLSLVLSYVIVFLIIAGAFFFIIPSLIQSISDMASSLTGLYNNLVKDITSLSERYPNPAVEYIQQTIKDSIPQYIDTFKNWAAGLAPNIANASMSFIKWIFNFIVAIIVSIYMLLDKGKLSRNLQRIIYSIFSQKKAEYIWDTLLRANNIFSGFIIGKTMDSLIIGILCLVLMKLFNIGGSYIFIISIFVGLTNMIPYFGPFIGAIPSAIIILLSVSPNEALAFIILIIILQQFDGNVLGPYILGDKTGLRPIWIIFAISIGGWLWGIVGMFLGVPCVAVISSIVDDLVERRLARRNINLPPIEDKSAKKDISKNTTELKKNVSNFIKKHNK